MEIISVESDNFDVCKMNSDEAKTRLDYLLTDFILPRETEKRQKVYEEIALLLEKVH